SLDEASDDIQEAAAHGRNLGKEIVDRIEANPEKPITARDTAVLQIQYRQLNNLFEEATARQDAAVKSGDAEAKEQADWDVSRYNEALGSMERAYELAGQAWGKAG